MGKVLPKIWVQSSNTFTFGAKNKHYLVYLYTICA